MAPPSRRPRSPPALMEELVEEILLRIPPAEPAHLFRAALVCKPWRRILFDPGFLRRYRAFHREPPLLGYFHNLNREFPVPAPPFVSTTAASPVAPPPPLTLGRRSGLFWAHADDCRHGRVLIETTANRLIVWDPITGDQKKLSVPNYPHNYSKGAVMCAVDGCDHLDCHAGAFLVVYCGTEQDGYQHKTWVAMYSSETGVWSSMISIDVDYYYVDSRPALIIGDALYFSFQYGVSLLKYDLRRHELSMINPPCVMGSVAMELDDGELGFAAVLDHCIYMWSWQAHANNGIGRWEQQMVMELKGLIPRCDTQMPEVAGLIEGTYTIFINDVTGVFKLDIKSRMIKKVGNYEAYYRILPYVSFYTPDLAKGILSPP